jgi:hypothetical protein
MKATKDVLIEELASLIKQATTEQSHYYTARVLRDAMHEITRLRIECTKVEALEVQLMSHGIEPVVRRSEG